MASSETWYVTWKDESNSTAARNSAQIWGIPAGGQPPPQLSGYFEAGPFPTQADAKAYENAIGTGSILPTPGTPIVGDIQNPISSWESALESIGSVISRLTSANLWERIGEVALGLILIAAGVSHMTHAVPLATKVAKAAGATALA
jgi:hypothetical protein